ncbi:MULTISPECIES: DUF7529 family protein [Halococcus]|uniref:Uncharacterized protein n=1 Tax=Halococcus salifodinae DSM 8989 TaxID=1227456 RepID=M0NB37_9EURY|nr:MULTISPECIES: hypothetical protein [Halococcus]EMA55056.1 hypothetical protein C450_03277 [Halococcus salifodinae DSM 8989]
MPEIDPDTDRTEAFDADTAALKDAWAATREDMDALAAEYDEEGWNTLTISAGDTAPEPPDAGDEDRFGLAHVIPDNRAEAFTEAHAAGEFPRYDVFRNEAAGRVFVVTVLLDPASETAILLAGTFERHLSAELAQAASEADEMYTHVQTLDGTQLGSFRHDDPEKFFPGADAVPRDD